MRTLTKGQAAKRADDHVKNAIAALPVEPSLKLYNDSSAECLDPTDDGPRGRYEVSKTYWLNGIPEDRNSEVADALYKHWAGSNYNILSDQRDGKEIFISVEHDDDAFGMDLTESVDGNLSINATSPCVWPHGVPLSDSK